MKDTSLFFPAVQIKFPDEALQNRAHTTKYADTTNERNRPAISFYLAAEEYVAQHYADLCGSCYFTWLTPPSVIVGRNQVLQYEVNLGVLQKKHIQLIRRKSGGGAVLSDGNNMMTSLVLGKQYAGHDIESIFHKYALGNVSVLQKFGIEAIVSGRNDILLGKNGEYGKVSGNAFYKQRQHNIVHGTMLYDADVNLMADVLLPDDKKLKFKGVKSVRSRVCTLRKYFELQGRNPEEFPSMEAFRSAFPEILCDKSLTLTEKDVANIWEIEATYRDVEYLYGNQQDKPHYVLEDRFDGCGKVAINLYVENDIVENVSLSGDFFELESGSAISAFQIFKGHRYDRAILLDVARKIDICHAIRGMNDEMLASLICQIGE